MHHPMQGAQAQCPRSLVPATSQGWSLQARSGTRKAHYYVDGLSLCARYSLGATVELDDENFPGRKACAECSKQWMKTPCQT